VYSFSGETIILKETITWRAPVSALAYSPRGELIAAGSASGKIVLYSISEDGEYTVLHEKFSFHTSRVKTLEFHPLGTHLASGALDSDIYIWKVNTSVPSTQRIQIKGAHGEGVWGVTWLSDKTIASTGADAAVKIWDITI